VFSYDFSLLIIKSTFVFYHICYRLPNGGGGEYKLKGWLVGWISKESIEQFYLSRTELVSGTGMELSSGCSDNGCEKF